MHIHILGICGTFMGGLAQIAKALGHEVTGSDQNMYPPMSEELIKLNIDVMVGYEPEHLYSQPDLVLVGNTLSRGNPVIEYMLNQRLLFTSGPEWLYREVLHKRHVLAVSGTHGKTTTTSILSWILEFAGLNPSFLIGGVAENFEKSASYTDSQFFVIEADEYDTAFFDKRSKFIHYRPDTLIINNIEYDHADIFHDLAAIRREFHNLVRILPKDAKIIYPSGDKEIERVLSMGCWTASETFLGGGAEWSISNANNDYSHFSINNNGQMAGEVSWSIIGEHNASNALAAIVAAKNIGIPTEKACEALSTFKSVKRRLECIFDSNNIYIYDDFAHHPTAIKKSLKALKKHATNGRIIAIMEPRSNTMRMGVHAETLSASFDDADRVFLYQAKDLKWNIADYMNELGSRCQVFKDVEKIIELVCKEVRPHDCIVVMSNGGFDNIHKKLIERLS